MLTEIDGKWIDLASVTGIDGNNSTGCTVWSPSGCMIFTRTLPKAMAELVNAAQAKAKVNVSVSGYVGEDARPSEATMGRIEILRDLVEEIDSFDNPDAAECWTYLRDHIKAKLLGWQLMAKSEKIGG